MSATKKRVKKMAGERVLVETGCGTMTVSAFAKEIFGKIKKSGGCATAMTEAMAALSALCVQNGVDPAEIVDQLSGIKCPSPSIECLSCPDGFSKAIAELFPAKDEGKG